MAPLTSQHLDLASRGRPEIGEWVGAVLELSLQETHHEAGASLGAGQLAGTRNLAHHQSLKLLQLLEESSANARKGNHEGHLRDETMFLGAVWS